MRVGINSLRVDLVLQKILGIIYITTGLLGIVVPGFLAITMITQFVIGCWQVLSALIFIIVDKSERRMPYILAVVIYLVGLFLTFYLMSQNVIPEGGLLSFILGMVILPISLGIWYFIITSKEYQEQLKAPLKDVGYEEEMEHILDSEELVR